MSNATLANPDVALKLGQTEEAYWKAHRGALLREYRDEFVAVQDDKVIAHHMDLQSLITILAAMNLKPTDLTVRYVTEDLARLLL